jgi:hypothetical protein
MFTNTIKMKLIHPKKILYLSKLTCLDCIDLILSFAFKQIHEHQRDVLSKFHSILKCGLSRTRVAHSFYRIWNDSDNDSMWSHRYQDSKRVRRFENFNCVQCGNYEQPYKPTIMNNAIICSCDTFCELYEELSMRRIG